MASYAERDLAQRILGNLSLPLPFLNGQHGNIDET